MSSLVAPVPDAAAPALMAAHLYLPLLAGLRVQTAQRLLTHFVPDMPPCSANASHLHNAWCCHTTPALLFPHVLCLYTAVYLLLPSAFPFVVDMPFWT